MVGFFYVFLVNATTLGTIVKRTFGMQINRLHYIEELFANSTKAYSLLPSLKLIIINF